MAREEQVSRWDWRDVSGKVDAGRRGMVRLVGAGVEGLVVWDGWSLA